MRASFSFLLPHSRPQYRDPAEKINSLRLVLLPRNGVDWNPRRLPEWGAYSGERPALLVVVSSSIAILHFERGPESNIKGPEDALWWPPARKSRRTSLS